jgi:hypothetical protein
MARLYAIWGDKHHVGMVQLLLDDSASWKLALIVVQFRF